ncbi:hypothetical protein TBLA_0A09510 [Henningerozyma blattae CBS 6284]|uniref:Uncharacterized protein n=1 Tax=Henningerozyma blattae (strain ATCC 34711 / CBS 6284 / DSM 70876 / NBRC 10599 / NRRL Y-10934 / UCD 77-7) TaxID=1071380 RepID=I2GX84_HENB6|nr:hypothetical protein TBLA_0A09510 [Tetrapisispora blattae CBS 6284]CCH58736.1 hypothetical protein TBLA_0A09510 [Tetrapisispora blattae CBS 6284]
MLTPRKLPSISPFVIADSNRITFCENRKYITELAHRLTLRSKGGKSCPETVFLLVFFVLFRITSLNTSKQNLKGYAHFPGNFSASRFFSRLVDIRYYMMLYISFFFFFFRSFSHFGLSGQKTNSSHGIARAIVADRRMWSKHKNAYESREY